MNKQKCIKRVLALFMIMVLVFTDFLGIWSNNVSAAKTVSVSKVKLDRTSATMMKGSTINLKATITPSNATNKKLKWTSSDKSVAVVYSSGRVLAKKAGKTTIKVTAGKKSASCRVTVKNPVAVKKVSLNKTIMAITPGKTTTLKATVYPSNATNKKIKWSSNNIKVASVSSTGIVKAKRVGTAKITARSADGTKKATCVMTVKYPTVAVSEVSINKSTVSMDVAEKIKLSAVVKPTNATNKSVVWSSDNSKVAKVDAQTGEVVAVSAGEAVITVTTKSGNKKDICKIIVKEEPTTTQKPTEEESTTEQVTTVQPTTQKPTEEESTTEQVTTVQPTTQKPTEEESTTEQVTTTQPATQKPTEEESTTEQATTTQPATQKPTEEESTTEQVTTTQKPTEEESTTEQVTTTQPATQKPTEEESTTEQATQQPTTEKQTEEQTTEAPTVTVTGISLNKKTLTLAKDDQEILKAIVEPNKEVQWTSSNTAVATVNSVGKVVAVGKGTATITARTEDGGQTADCIVTVNIPVTGISVTSNKEVALEYKENAQPTYQCNVKVLPADAENQKVTWSSSNPEVATVDATGKITAVERGTATITVTTADGAKTDTVNVYVYKNANQWLASDWYRFLSFIKPELVMSVNTTTPKDGVKVVLSENGEASNQVWKFVKSANMSEKIEITPKCANGAYVLNATNDLMDVWSIGKQVNTSNWEVLKHWDNNWTYFIRIAGSDKVLSIKNAEVGAQLVLKEFNPFDDTQKWLVADTLPIAVTGVTLNKTTVTLNKSATVALTATVAPSDATNSVVNWSSSDTTVVTVDKTGKVTAVDGGTATITAKTADGGKIATCTVTVNVPLENIRLDKEKVALDFAEGENHIYRCKVTFTPMNATNQNLIWSSSDPKIATVDAEGKITAVERGVADITVKSADGGKTDVIKVYVYKESTQYALGGENKNWHFKLSANTGLAMSVASTSVTNGMKVQLSEYVQNSSQTWNLFGIAGKNDQMEITPQCASGKFVINNSNNLISMLTAANRGKDSTWKLIKLWNDHNHYIIRLTGTQSVIAASSATKGSQLVLKEFDPFDELQVWGAYTFYSPSDVSITNNNKKVENVALDIGKTFQCTATVSPEIAVNTNVTWSSSDTKIATVDLNGKVTAVARGTAKITVKTVDGGKTDSFVVCVYDSKAEARGEVNEDAGWWFKLKLSKNQSFVMDAVGGIAQDNIKIILYADNGTGAQMWKMTGKVGAWNMIPMCQGEHGYYLASSNNTEGSGLQLLKNGNINFEWIQLGDANNNNIYALKLAGTDLAVSAPTTIKSEAQVVLKKFNPFDEAQKWIVEGVSCPAKVTITSNKTNVTLDVGNTFQCSATVSPTSAVNKNVTWSSSNTSVATVDASGKVTAVGSGTADIVVTTVVGGKTDSFTIQVKEPATDYASKLNALRMEFPNGSAWTGSFDKASQCHGWALLIGNRISGVSARTWKTSNTLDGVKTGDLIRYGGDVGHTIVVLSVSGDMITYADCNGSGSKVIGDCIIKWGATVSKSGKKLFGYTFNYRLVAP